MKGTKFLIILVMATLIQGIVFSIYVNASTITYNSWNKKTFNYSMSVNAVFTADVDYDNDVDIFAVVGGNLILLENINNNDWVKHTIIESSIWGRDVVYVDIDNDGSGEVFFSNDNLGVIMIELNESNNISNYTRVLRSSPWTIWYGDVDGDNYTEVVTEYVYVIDYNQSTNTISYYSVIRSDIGAFLAHDVRCGNYDSDANDEIIVDSMSFYGNATTIYLLDYVNNTQWDISPIYNFSYAIYTLFSADLDNNGIDEIICGTEDGSIIILSKVNTTWTEIASFSIISDYVVYNIYATDVDADGIVDIVAKIGPRTTGNKSVIKFFDMASLYPLNFTMIDVGETDTWGNIHSLVCTNLDNDSYLEIISGDSGIHLFDYSESSINGIEPIGQNLNEGNYILIFVIGAVIVVSSITIMMRKKTKKRSHIEHEYPQQKKISNDKEFETLLAKYIGKPKKDAKTILNRVDHRLRKKFGYWLAEKLMEKGLYEDVIDIFIEIGDVERAISYLISLAINYKSKGDLEKARELYLEAARLLRKIGKFDKAYEIEKKAKTLQ